MTQWAHSTSHEGFFERLKHADITVRLVSYKSYWRYFLFLSQLQHAHILTIIPSITENWIREDAEAPLKQPMWDGWIWVKKWAKNNLIYGDKCRSSLACGRTQRASLWLPVIRWYNWSKLRPHFPSSFSSSLMRTKRNPADFSVFLLR